MLAHRHLPLLALLATTAGAAEFTIPAGDVAALRSALASAAETTENDTIRLAASSTYTLTDSGITIPGGIILEGNSATIARSTASATPAFTVVTTADGSNLVAGDSDIEIRDLTVANGRLENPSFGEGGGGINNANGDGLVTLTRCTIRDSSSTGNGGGIFHGFFSDELKLVGCTIQSCTAGGTGGGLHADQDITLEDTIFIGNSAIGNGGGLTLANDTIIAGGRFENNTSDALGGGIYLEGDVDIIGDCALIGNSATEGGGIYADDTLTWTGTGGLMRQNTATNNNGGGGALSLNRAASFEGVAFEMNSAAEGGAINARANATFTTCTWQGNSAELGGGAIFSEEDLTFTECSFTENRGTGGFGSGGAIQMRDDDDPPNLLILDSVFTGNTSSSSGGAINVSEGVVTLRRTSFAGNSCTGSGGAIAASGNISIERCSFTANRADISTGATGNGGAIRILGNEGNLRIDRSYFKENSSTISGGAVFIQSIPIAIVERCAFLSNFTDGETTGSSGGGALATSGPPIILRNSTFTDNSSSSRGGGVQIGFSQDPSFILGCTFTDNTATLEGAGIHARGAKLQLGNTIASGNTTIGSPADIGGTTITSLGYNFITDLAGTTITGENATDTTGADPQLAALIDTGDYLSARSPANGSPVLDAGRSTLGTAILTDDQRGFSRPSDLPTIANATGSDGTDIGAVEATAPDTPQPGGTAIVNTTDPGFDGICGTTHCSIRDALDAVMQPGGPTTVTFDETVFPPAGPAQTILLRSALPPLEGTFTIQGPGAQAIIIARDQEDITAAFPIFEIRQGAAITIRGLTLTGGEALAPDFDGRTAGGGIYCDGQLTLENSTIRDCRALLGGGIFATRLASLTLTNCEISNNIVDAPDGIRGNPTGGGLYQDFGVVATNIIRITNTRFTNNIARITSDGLNSVGGAIRTTGPIELTSCIISGNQSGSNAGAEFRGPALVDRCTFANNIASFFVGALDIDQGTIINSTFTGNNGGTRGAGAILATEETIILHSTITGNTTTGEGGGIRIDNSRSVNMGHTVVAGNTAEGNGPDILGRVVSRGYNLVGDVSDGFAAIFGDTTGDIIGADPLLASLADNGGPVPTIASLDGSPLRNAGNPTIENPPPTDARGLSRIAEGRIDIGAYENAATSAGLDYATYATQQTIGSPTEDEDRDGASNLLEFALGTLPRNPSSFPSLPLPTPGTPSTFTLAKPPGLTGVTYQIESSSDLELWSTDAITITSETSTALSITITAQSPHFLRLVVTLE